MESSAVATLEKTFLEHTRKDHEDFLSIHSRLDKLAEDHPTNGELGLMLGNVARDIGEIKVQTTRTNGRVSKLEAAKHMAIGGLVLTNIIIVPIAIAMSINFLKK